MPKKTRAAASNAVAAEADSGDESAVAPKGGETWITKWHSIFHLAKHWLAKWHFSFVAAAAAALPHKPHPDDTSSTSCAVAH